MARDFSSDFVLNTAGILDVFQGFDKQKLGEKIRRMPMTIDSEIPGARQVPTLPYELHKSAYNIIKHRRYYYVWTYQKKSGYDHL